MLMITVKYILIVGSFRIYEIEVFIDIIISNFNKAHTSSGLSGGHWQRTIAYVHWLAYVALHVRKQPIPGLLSTGTKIMKLDNETEGEQCRVNMDRKEGTKQINPEGRTNWVTKSGLLLPKAVDELHRKSNHKLIM